MFHVSGDVERTFLRKLDVPFDIQTAFLLTTCGIDQRVGRTGKRFDFDAFAVLDMHGRARIDSRHVGQVEIIQLDGGFVRSFVVEAAVT